MSRRPRALIATSLLIAACAAPTATAADVHPVKLHVDLTLVKRTGTTKFEHKGRATGTVRGTVRSTITLSHSVALHGTVTISTQDGKVRMTIDGRARSLGLRTKFTGKAKVTGGTGKYAGATGTGSFSGTVNRTTWHVTLDATGSYHY